MAYLVLVRHGQSEWNAKGLWTGLTDISLSPTGIEEAKKAAEALTDIQFNIAFTSHLKRAQETLHEILQTLNQTQIQSIKNQAINERDYGDMTGKNKWDLKKEFGEEQFLKWRRSWDFPIPGGETLKDVYNRAVPYFKKEILPHLELGENVLVVAHGNSLRALVKYLENISDDGIPKLEIATGEIYVYQVDQNGIVTSKEIRAARENNN